MDYKDRATSILENLKNIEENTFLTDAHKEKINFIFKLTSTHPDTPYVKVNDEEDYELIIKYIITEISNSNFIFHKEGFHDKNRYLFLQTKN